MCGWGVCVRGGRGGGAAGMQPAVRSRNVHAGLRMPASRHSSGSRLLPSRNSWRHRTPCTRLLSWRRPATSSQLRSRPPQLPSTLQALRLLPLLKLALLENLHLSAELEAAAGRSSAAGSAVPDAGRVSAGSDRASEVSAPGAGEGAPAQPPAAAGPATPAQAGRLRQPPEAPAATERRREPPSATWLQAPAPLAAAAQAGPPSVPAQQAQQAPQFSLDDLLGLTLEAQPAPPPAQVGDPGGEGQQRYRQRWHARPAGNWETQTPWRSQQRCLRLCRSRLHCHAATAAMIGRAVLRVPGALSLAPSS